jgi:hypothetical protein
MEDSAGQFGAVVAILRPLSCILAAQNPPRLVDLLPEDPFDFFRWWLGTIATIYATVITLQSLWGWYAWLAGSDRYMSLLRRYLIVHGLRLRFTAFWGDVIICCLLTVAFLMLWRAHALIYQLGYTLHDVRQHP